MCKPFVYYVLQDFIAVDAGQGRAWRAQLRGRWEESPVFRRVLWEVNAGWVLGGLGFCGALAGVVWGVRFDVAYGVSFGLFFGWVGCWGLGTWVWVKRGLGRERVWFARRGGGRNIGLKDGDVV